MFCLAFWRTKANPSLTSCGMFCINAGTRWYKASIKKYGKDYIIYIYFNIISRTPERTFYWPTCCIFFSSTYVDLVKLVPIPNSSRHVCLLIDPWWMRRAAKYPFGAHEQPSHRPGTSWIIIFLSSLALSCALVLLCLLIANHIQSCMLSMLFRSCAAKHGLCITKSKMYRK